MFIYAHRTDYRRNGKTRAMTKLINAKHSLEQQIAADDDTTRPPAALLRVPLARCGWNE
jgi:hypothetical protein